jgi:hypothetical protein
MVGPALRTRSDGSIAPAPGESGLAEHAQRLTARALDKAPTDRSSPQLRRLAAHPIAPWAQKLVSLLDETLRIPGTNIHIGLDPIVGFLVPGAGDVITSTVSVWLLLLALKERVPTIAILRMLVNIAIDALAGTVPVAGDAFDVIFRSNRRNLEIIEKYRNDPKAKPSVADYVLVSGGILLGIVTLLLPFVIFGLGAVGVAALWRAITG